MTIQAQCKFCRVPLTLSGDDECPPLQVEKWMPLICCNRCGSFREWWRRKIKQVVEVCYNWAVLPGHKREAARMQYEQEIEVLTRAMAAVVCQHHRVGVTWERDFVAQLMERPDKAEFICRQYEDIVQREGLKRKNRTEEMNSG